MLRLRQWFTIIVIALFVASCGTQKPLETGQYRVVKGDTLTKIARQHGQTVASLMRMNNLSDPNTLKVGQILTVQGSSSVAPAPPSQVQAPSVGGAPMNAPRTIKLIWPAEGQAQRGTSNSTSKGITIKGKRGDPIKAATAGEVVYASNSLRGYGNMVIINHDANFLTVYAHNDSLKVKQGDKVKQGQTIATMGDTGTNTIQLYFEVRYNGKPVNAYQHLPKQ